jgi:hypothetical protein
MHIDSGEWIMNDTYQEEFDRLQRKLLPLWRMIGSSEPGGQLEDANTTIVVPSLTGDFDIPAPALQAFEQRFLFMLFLLQQPRKRIIYVTSMPVEQVIVDYYLDTLPGVVISNARRRLFMVSVHDATAESLTAKLLARPHLVAYIRSLVPDPDLAHIMPFMTTDLERELALRMGIPMYGADPTYYVCGTKSGGRQIFADAGVLYPIGEENLTSPEALAAAICRLRAQKPGLAKLIVKLNAGVAGMGNANVDLAEMPPPGDPAEEAAAAEALRQMHFELESVTYDNYMSSVRKDGAIVEELISGEQLRSPSAQLRISPLGEVEMLSTHDQILGGPSGQTFLGASFPADKAYAWPIMREARKIGQRLAQEGVIGRFAVDFVAVKQGDGAWQPYAIEINLRKGGTTAPFLSLQYLTDGQYDAEAGVFRTSRSNEKCYVANDHLESPRYRVFTPESLLDIVSAHRLHFDHTTQTGILLHMFNNVGGAGQLGVTAVGDSPAHAETIYRALESTLEQEAEVRLS